jgi:ATP-dependent Lon protease
LDIEFDASLVIYIATSNDPGKVPAPLLSRFREFEILAPRGEQALQVAREVVAATIRRQAVPGFVVPARSLAHQLAHLTPREISQAVQDAVGRAIERGRLHLALEDFPAELLGLDKMGRVLH